MCIVVSGKDAYVNAQNLARFLEYTAFQTKRSAMKIVNLGPNTVFQAKRDSHL